MNAKDHYTYSEKGATRMRKATQLKEEKDYKSLKGGESSINQIENYYTPQQHSYSEMKVENSLYREVLISDLNQRARVPSFKLKRTGVS